VLFVGEAPAAFAATLYRPHPKVADVMGCSRLVTLPDFQGLGLAFALIDRVSAAYKAMGKRMHTYPAHPALIRGFDRSPMWALRQKPGHFSQKSGHESSGGFRFGGRPNAVFSYAGPAMAKDEAAALLAP
jgi:GNAT superfamily N-acetyltransferase